MKKIIELINSILKNDDNNSIIEENTQKEVIKMSAGDFMVYRTRARGKFLIENKGVKVIRLESDRKIKNNQIIFNVYYQDIFKQVNSNKRIVINI